MSGLSGRCYEHLLDARGVLGPTPGPPWPTRPLCADSQIVMGRTNLRKIALARIAALDPLPAPEVRTMSVASVHFAPTRKAVGSEHATQGLCTLAEQSHRSWVAPIAGDTEGLQGILGPFLRSRSARSAFHDRLRVTNRPIGRHGPGAPSGHCGWRLRTETARDGLGAGPRVLRGGAAYPQQPTALHIPGGRGAMAGQADR